MQRIKKNLNVFFLKYTKMYDTICLNVTFVFKTSANGLFVVKSDYVAIFLIIVRILEPKTI
ncbi:hypothetical protein AAJ76_1470003442 [Vairimorpha ceranae]|uniref:Uncharacterized protein n=1 Tax=Vairimorpha ceranae TaxID=40302 RepID=A0A0F9WAN7_9MICR|nr:hypothetical protein AAJ76_1470003442 [Vairimorpha ceranae]KKO73995.1 hypothetical protein AAJ76_1470003442 [Vairimorpha ceranae]